MEPLEQVTILMTLMHRLEQVMDQERDILGGMRVETLPDLQEEKDALVEAYAIEMARLRRDPERVGQLDPAVRQELESAMRRFQQRLNANLQALRSAHQVVEKVLGAIGESLARAPSATYRAGGEMTPPPAGARIIPLAFDRQL